MAKLGCGVGWTTPLPEAWFMGLIEWLSGEKAPPRGAKRLRSLSSAPR
jgi:hypothetical protein